MNKDDLQKMLEHTIPEKDFKKDFFRDIQKNNKRISSGYPELDIILDGGFFPELYIMVAETGTGKSALMMDFAKNISLQDVNVLYFSLEMSHEELTARNIAATSYSQHLMCEENVAWTTGSLLHWVFDFSTKEFHKTPIEKYENYANDYFNNTENLYVIENSPNGLTIKDITDFTIMFLMQHTDKPLVIVIDYLQILRPDSTDRSQSDRKNKLDVATIALKSLSSQYQIPVITCSSVPRSKYGKRITTDSFKESGDIEYNGGILLGWNWEGVTTNVSEKEANKEEKECINRGWRNMTLELLKSRNGERNKISSFKYYPAYNFFEINNAPRQNINCNNENNYFHITKPIKEI